MKFITGNSRNQVQIFCLEDYIHPKNDVRFIDLFVDTLPLGDMGFHVVAKANGRPPYHPADLLKLFLYGYLNQIRSSRKLELECKRNIELMWLMKGLAPDHNTIANFRKEHPDAIRNVFKATVSMAKNFELIGGKLIAGDGTKLRAQNSKKNNFNEKKINQHIEYIDKKLAEYNEILAREDGDTVTKKEQEEIKEKIAKHQQNKERYQKLQQQLEATNEQQISTTDPDSRQMIVRNGITEVAYNVQSTVDAQNNIPIDYLLTNKNDTHALGEMLGRAKDIIGHNEFTALYDKGYHTAAELAMADEMKINVLVAIPEVSSQTVNPKYNVANFKYIEAGDYYICPQGNTLHTNGNWYNKSYGKHRSTVRVKHYKTPDCKICPVFEQCTKNKSGRLLERNEHQEAVNNNRLRVEQNKDLYRLRQQIVEHPFGIMKRQWGFSYIMTKRTLLRASADVGFIFCAYNLRRILNLVDRNVLKAWLKGLFYSFYKNTAHSKPHKASIFFKAHFSSQNIAARIAA